MKKPPCRDTVPPGPWYASAWKQLSEAERARLESHSRKGRPTPILQDSPVSLLSAPSKMPGYSWGMTAGKSCPGAEYEADSEGHAAICASCYASGQQTGQRGGSYSWPTVKRAYLVRMWYAKLSMMSDASRAEYVETLTASIGRYAVDPFFRIHDSGDFFTPRYVEAWASIIAALPAIHFWAPTRSYWIAEQRPGTAWSKAFERLNALANAAIRPSALYVNVDAPSIPGYFAGSGVKSDDWNCPASTQGNECRDCRACWTTPEPIYYHLH